MMIKQYELYIDESGDFNDRRPDRPKPKELSMVGGILCDPGKLTKQKINGMFQTKVHCKDGYDKKYIQLLEDLKREGHRFIVFENTEQIKVINPNYTYINIISEGLVKLFRDLASQHPDGVKINVVIAQRMMKLGEYRDRIIEKTMMAYGREQIKGCDYQITIEDARSDKRLFIADIICNTYLTRNRKEKFDQIERERIANLFNPDDIYSVFEDATEAYIKQLLLDRHWGEAICQICTLPHLKSLTQARDILIRRLVKATQTEREYYLGQMSIELKICEGQGQFEEGIALGNNFKQYFLERLSKYENTKRDAAFCQFDTDFHLLTMYDHLGNTKMMEASLEACRNNLDAVSTSWEKLDYYFLFRIRELNTLMDLFRFEEVLEKAKKYEDLFSDTRRFFERIREDAGIDGTIRSNSLGKIEGIRLQAMTNLIARKPELYQEALAASDRALSEFDQPTDQIRQWGYRSKLMLQAGKLQEALGCLYEIAERIHEEGQPFAKILQYVYREGYRPNEYLLLDYTGIMVALINENDPSGQEMAKTLFEHPRFAQELKNREKQGYPWNVILWHMAQYYRLENKPQEAIEYYRQSLSATEQNKKCSTVFSFALAILAEALIHSAYRTEEEREEIENQWLDANRKINLERVPLSIRQWFQTDHPDAALQAQSAWK